MRVRFLQSARKHKIGRAHALYVMETTDPMPWTTKFGEPAQRWVGPDERGVEMEIVAVEEGEGLLVIHVMPLYRGGK